ncbi:ferredoxin--NADP reductase [Larkinella terrae]|uniref:2Fe-2S iron-sulfur cluster binding domain-containing protein n=1 Tax=Larkinella terrae TaxID=2025311 RepID=A0A7K0EDK8_9BACT|nr:ferredoxin--NADP reductase [Larkinella terrae]MRS59959.1 2Fe-2S iron-sulfur cluster binding domain-containing protein [Larkinella terrae]
MNEELIHLQVSEIIRETHDTKTLLLQPTNGQSIRYQAGQFLTLLFYHLGHEVRRSYSLSSTPGDASPGKPSEPLSLTIKRVENGEISRYLLDHLRAGDTLTSLPPTGRFTLETDPDQQRDIVLIGAGSGITPLFGILKQVLRDEPKSHVTLLDCNTSERNIIFSAQLETLKAQHPERFQLIHLLSQPSDDWRQSGTIRRGRLNNWLLENMLPELTRFTRDAARWYICGPFPFMRMVQITLIYAGIRLDAIKKENFVIEPVTRTPPPELAKDHRILLRYRGTDYDIDVPAYKSVLQAALDHGIPLPYSCKGGRCSSCAVRLKAGEIHMTINDVLTERDLSNGWVLTCTGYPASEGVILEV